MKTLIFLLVLGVTSWHWIDLESTSVLASLLAPIGFILSLAGFAGWIVGRLGLSASSSTDSGYYADGDGGGGCGD